MGARETALNALIACRKDGAWSNGILKEYVVRDRLDGRDAALAARLCYGVLQNRNKLDFYLKQLLTGKLKDLHPVVHDILHLGLYQIYEMDKIPESAAVNESVDLAKKYCKKQRFAPGLVNGVLRNAVKSKGTLKEPASLEDKYSHPWELVKLLRDYVGRDRIEMMLKANNEAPSTTVQVNTLKIAADQLQQRLEEEGVSARPHAWMPDCLVLSGTGDLEKLPAFREGLFYVQDPAAKLSVLCAQLPEDDIRILDCCSAPGGKSFAASIATAGKASITSCDVHEHKIALIGNGAARLGMENITPRLQDATENVPQWLKPYLLAAQRSGLTANWQTNEDYNAPITGAEAAVILQNALDLTVSSDVLASEHSQQWDESLSAHASASLTVMAENGITFPAGQTMTRADVANVLYQVSKIAPDAPGMVVFRMQQ